MTYGDTFGLDLPLLAKKQMKNGCGSEKIKLSGAWFYSFHVTMDLCQLHSKIDSENKGISQSQFHKSYSDDSGGFCVKFDGLPDPKLIIFLRGDVLQHATYIQSTHGLHVLS